MLKSLRENVAKLPTVIAKHQNLIVVFVIGLGLTLGAGLLVGELWGEGKTPKPLTPSSEKYPSHTVASASTSSAEPSGSVNTAQGSSGSGGSASTKGSVKASSSLTSLSSGSTSKTTTSSNSKSVKVPPPPPPSPTNPVNINTASAKELDALPGIGATYAQRIINNRPYSSTDELVTKKDPGTGKAILYLSTYNKIKDMISVQ